MSRLAKYKLIIVLFLCPWWIEAQIHVPWHCSFEDTEDLSNWVLNPGTGAATDQWCIGSAVRSEGKRALYISNTQGMTAGFGSQPNIAIAYAVLNMPVGTKEYDISFDFCTLGGTAGTLYVFFDNESKLISGSTWEQLLQYASATGAKNLPSRVKDKARYVCSVLPSNSSRTQALTDQEKWKTVSIDAGLNTNYSERFTTTTSKRPQALVFMWVNRNTDVNAQNMGACIDNIQICSATIQKPTNLYATPQCADSSITLSWNGVLDGYMVEYRKSATATWRKYTYTGDVALRSHTYRISGLTDGTYDFRVWGWKKVYDTTSKQYVSDTTGWISVNNVLLYCPENQCINYINLDLADCTYGPVGNLYKYHRKVDYGSDNVLSIHTVNIDQSAYDIRTDNMLKIIPDGAMASVRLGNWYSPESNSHYHPDVGGETINGQSITYDFTVDPNNSVLLLQYTMIFEESAHEREQQPYFKLSIYDETGKLVDADCGVKHFYCPLASDETQDEIDRRIAEENWQVFRVDDPHFIQNKSLGFNTHNIWWKPWSTMGLDLTPYANQNLRVVIESSGCGLTAHYGYGYFTLGCTSAAIETDQCGLQPLATAYAPTGFDYHWYAEEDSALYEAQTLKAPDGHNVIVSYTNELTVKAGDLRRYVCRLFYKDTPSCYFELSTVLSPRNPYAMHLITCEPSDCRNMVSLRDSSRIINYGPDGKLIVTAEECEYSQWTIRSFVTGDVVNSAGTRLTYEANLTGDTLEITHTAFIADGACDDLLIDTVIVPDILTQDQVVADTICDNTKYAFADTLLNTPGTYYNRLSNRYGCDSTIILHLWVKPTSLIEIVDTISGAQLPYVLEGVYKGQRQHYEVGELKNCISTDNYVLKLTNRYDCDSTLNVNLTVVPLLNVSVDDLPVLCADGGNLRLSYHITQGDYDSLRIRFSHGADKQGFHDTIYRHDPYQHPVIPPVDMDIDYPYLSSVLPDIYTVSLDFYQHSVCGPNRHFEFPVDIRYASSVIGQKWNDVLAVLNPMYNGGYAFSDYRWYKNGVLIPGQNQSYLYLPEGLDFQAAYSACLTRATDGVKQFTCEIIPAPHTDIYQFPTVVAAGQPIAARTDNNAEVRFYSLSGTLVSVQRINAHNTITAPLCPGYYIVQVYGENQNAQTVKVLVTTE